MSSATYRLRMSDRSDELTTSRDPPSTEELLEETDRLLAGEGSSRPTDAADAERTASETEGGVETDVEPPDTDGEAGSRSRLRTAARRLSPTTQFSPRAALALALVLAVGLFVGGSVLPIAGHVLGLLAVAFVVGLVTAKRRYLEVGLAGGSVGAIGAFFDYAVTAFLVGGSGSRALAVGTAASLLAVLVGYYFGRDLRAGLTREI